MGKGTRYSPFDAHYEDHFYEIWEETWHQIKRIEKCDLELLSENSLHENFAYIISLVTELIRCAAWPPDQPARLGAPERVRRARQSQATAIRSLPAPVYRRRPRHTTGSAIRCPPATPQVIRGPN